MSHTNHGGSIVSDYDVFKRAITSEERPQRDYRTRTTAGCMGGSVLESGYAKIVNGRISFDQRKWTHPELHRLNGLYVMVSYAEWLCIHLRVVGGPFLDEIETNQQDANARGGME